MKTYNKKAQELQKQLQEYGDVEWKVKDELGAEDDYGNTSVFVVMARDGKKRAKVIMPIYIYDFDDGHAVQAIQYEIEKQLDNGDD